MLSKPDIIRYWREGRIRFDPDIDEADIAQVSVDLRLGRKFTVPKKLPEHIPAICVAPSIWDLSELWEHYEADTFRLHPGQFVLAQTLQSVAIPSDLVGLVEGRSSWARLGLTIHVTAPKIDPGFDACITLEMANFGPAIVELRAHKDKPAQLMFLRVSTPLEDKDLYGSSPNDTFQGQTTPVPRKRS